MPPAEGNDVSKEDLAKLSVAELKQRLFWAGVTVQSGLEKSELIAEVEKAICAQKKAAESEDLSKLSVADLKKRLFWLGGSLPSGGLEKLDLIAAVRSAQAERDEKIRKGEQKKRVEAAPPPEPEKPAKPKEDPRPLNYEKKAESVEQQEVVDLFLLSDAELKRRIEQAGHDLPEGEEPSRHYLVALCRTAIRNPKERTAKEEPAKPAEEGQEQEPSTELKVYRRPTVKDLVQIVESDLTKRYCPNAVGRVFKIIKDAGGWYPYKLAGLEDRHWFGEKDVKWPDPPKKKKAKNIHGEPVVNQPKQVMIMQNRYGCTQGELKQVLRQSENGANWILEGGRQVPKAHEGTGWGRIDEPEAPPPPPPPDSEAPPAESQATNPPQSQDDAVRPMEQAAEIPEDDDRDPCELSPSELKQRLRLYPGNLLLGLSEKSELVDALREAIRTLGPPPKRSVRPFAPEGIASTEEEMVAQMEEMAAELDEGTMQNAAAAGAAAVEAAAAAKLATASQAETSTPSPCSVAPAAAPPAATADVPARKRRRVTTAGNPPDKACAPVSKTIERRKATAEPAASQPRAKRRRPKGSSEVLVSDGDDEDVCAMAPAISLDLDEDDDMAEVCAVAPKESNTVAAKRKGEAKAKASTPSAGKRPSGGAAQVVSTDAAKGNELTFL